MKKSLFTLLTLALVMILSVSAFAATYTDIEGHWAQESIERWTAEKVLNGYSDNTFKPDNLLTRAEYVAIISRMFEPKNVADVSKFKDLEKGAWYYESFARVFTLNAIQGTSSSTMDPDENITRQEAIVILNRILELVASKDATLEKYSDASSIAKWAEKDILAFSDFGYVQGYEDGTVRPTRNITRAECAKILDAVIGKIIRKSGEYDLTGIKGSIIVLAENVTLKNADLDRVFVANENVKKTLKVENVDDSDIVIIDEKAKTPKSSGGSGGGSSRKTETLKVTFTRNGDMYNITKEGNVKDGVKFTLVLDGETIVDGETFSSANFSNIKETVVNYILANAKARKDDCERIVKTAYENYYKTDKKAASVALFHEIEDAINATAQERADIITYKNMYINGTMTGRQLWSTYKNTLNENGVKYRDRIVVDVPAAFTYDMAKELLEIL